jgi:hypothetical protein
VLFVVLIAAVFVGLAFGLLLYDMLMANRRFERLLGGILDRLGPDVAPADVTASCFTAARDTSGDLCPTRACASPARAELVLGSSHLAV